MYGNDRIRRITFTALLCLFSALTVFAGSCREVIIYPAPREQAKSGKPLFDYREIELDNGLKVITLEDFSCPIVEAQVWYHVGSKNEQPDRQGFAHMFEHMMFKGTDRLGPSDHFDFIQRVGGTNNAYTSFDTTVYRQTLPENQLELALWLEAERMGFLRIDQESFDTERKVVEEELRMRENEPFGTLFKKQFAELFKLHPYRWTPIGKLGHLRASSVAELRDFWTRYYVPNNATLIIVGAVKHKTAQRFAEQYFGWIPRCDEAKRVIIREPELKKSRTMIIDDENAPAGMVEVNWRTVPFGHRDETVLDLLSVVLGGGNSSKLYRELVAQKQLAVSAKASTYNMEHDGVFYAQAMHSPDKDPNELLEAIWRHIEKAASEGVTEQELTKAKNQMLKLVVTEKPNFRGKARIHLTIKGKARMLGAASVLKADTSRVNTMLAEIRSVTTEDLQRAANQYLTDNKAYTFIVKPNPKGAMAGKKDDETALVTAQREETAPAPGRKGVSRPKTFPQKAPFDKLKTSKLTPGYSTTTLDNGLKVMVVPNHEVPFVTIKLGLLNGAWTENKPGTASMAMNMLTKGTKKHTEGQLAEELERYAISLWGSAGMDTSQVNAHCLSEHLDRALELLAEVVLEPVFDEAEFEKLRKQVLTTLAIQTATPKYLADKEFRKRLYGDHPYARTVTGELIDVEALQTQDVRQWWDKFVRPDNATLVFAGDIEHAKAVALAQDTLGKWRDDTPPPVVEITDIPAETDTQIYVVDQPGSMQSEIRIGQLGITRHLQPEYFISRVVGYYFGGSFNSRLNDTIRVKKGLTYSVFGGYMAQALSGAFRLSTFTKTDSTAETVQVALDEIRRLQTEEPTEKELADTKSYIAGSFVRQRETPQQIARDLWLIESQKLGDDYLERLLAKIAQTTKEDCKNLVDETLNPDKMIIVVVGDAAKIKAQLETIAPVTILAAQKG